MLMPNLENRILYLLVRKTMDAGRDVMPGFLRNTNTKVDRQLDVEGPERLIPKGNFF